MKRIVGLFPGDIRERGYHEPFFGGGAVFFHVEPNSGSINDINPKLMAAMMERVKAPGAWKDEVKIARHREEAKTKLIEKAALSPRTGRIVSVGVGVRDGGESPKWDNHCFVDRVNDERALLEAIDSALAETQPLYIYSYNGRRFDFPFLAVRAMMHGMKLKHRWPVGYDNRHLDLWDFFGKEGSLNEWAAAILGRTKPSSGAAIQEMVDQERFDEIIEHNLWDVEAVEELVDRSKLAADCWRR